MATLKFIEYPERDILWRVPEKGNVKLGDGLICQVRSQQSVVLLGAEDRVLVKGPGRHELTAKEIESLKARAAKKSDARMYFVGHEVVSGTQWATKRPVKIRDRSGKDIGLRVSGHYSFRVGNAVEFVKSHDDTKYEATGKGLRTRLADMIWERLSRSFQASFRTLEDLPLCFSELATEARLDLQYTFERAGLELIDFYISSIDADGVPAPRKAKSQEPASAFHGSPDVVGPSHVAPPMRMGAESQSNPKADAKKPASPKD